MSSLDGVRVPGAEHACCAAGDVELVDLVDVDAAVVVAELIERQAPALQGLTGEQLQVVADASRARRRECCCQVPPVDRRI